MVLRRKFSAEFKAEAVKLARQPGVSVTSVAHFSLPYLPHFSPGTRTTRNNLRMPNKALQPTPKLLRGLGVAELIR